MTLRRRIPIKPWRATALVPVDGRSLAAMVGVLSSLGAAYRIILAKSISDEPITLSSNERPDNDEGNFYTEHASRTLNSGRQ